METYSVDIDPGQVVRWVKAELEVAPTTLRVSGRRSQAVERMPLSKELHLGDEEREDLSEVATLATSEIAPAHTGEGWQLSVVVEGELGPRISGTAPEADAKNKEFIGENREFERQTVTG